MIRTLSDIGCILLIFFSCSRSGKEEKNLAGSQEKIYDAIVLRLGKKPIEVSLPAEIRPQESARIFSKVNGFIKYMYADIGLQVHKGDLLALIEAPELNSQLSEARFKRNAAKARFLGSKDTYMRTRESSETPGVISMNDLEKTESQMISDSSNFSAAQYYLSSIEDLNNYLKITSPFDGTVTIRNMNIGDITGSPNSKPIFEVENNNILRVRIAIPEVYVGNSLASENVNFVVSAYPGRLFNAHFVRKAGSLDIATRTETWEFESNNTDHLLLAGMYAELKVKLIRKESSVFVPKSAIVTSLEKSFVIRLKNSKTEWIDISKGNTIADKTEVFGNLIENDTILSSSNEEIKPGTSIKFKVSEIQSDSHEK